MLIEQKSVSIPNATWINAVLIARGYLGNAPWSPSIALSVEVLTLYKTLSARCPQLGVQAFAQMLCNNHQVCNLLSEALDVFLEIHRHVDLKVNTALNRDHTWCLKNACPSCTYTLEGERRLRDSILTTMDGNNSLKRVLRVRRVRNEQGEVQAMENTERTTVPYPNDYYIEPNDVDHYKDEEFQNTMLDSNPNIPCSERWKNMADESTKSMWGVFDETGIFVCLCRHGFVLVCCDMIKSGELAKYPLALTNKLLNVHGANQYSGYDIGCGFSVTQEKGLITGAKVRAANHECVCGSFHGHAHNRLCQLRFHLLYRQGCGLEDFEGCERFFYESNGLGGRTRHQSKYHQMQAIVHHLQRWGSDKYLHLSKLCSTMMICGFIHVVGQFLYNNFRQAIRNLQLLKPQLEAAKKMYGIDSNAVFHSWLQQEEQYLQTLKKELPEDILKVKYLLNLQKLSVAEYVLLGSPCHAKVSGQWLQVPAQEIRKTNFYENEWRSTSCHETARASRLETVLTLQEAVCLLEQKPGIHKQWDSSCPEWMQTQEYVARRDYHRTIDMLEGLVVSHLFEMLRMNQSGLCYKLRVKIAQALKAWAGAIRTAIEKYNQAAEALPEPRSPLDVKDVLEYVSLGEFDLLRDSRHQLREQPWARPGERDALNIYFKILRSEEELERVCIEARRLHTYMIDEATYMRSILSKLEEAESALAP
ncbi:hypothetical protein K439DRAFT_1369517 [Ramaria rubella]|nr:hypothetical protein K439DRAFT_1369517 [Ramaria rubella]